MKIADLMILNNISSHDLQRILQDPMGKITVGFFDLGGKQEELDIAPLFRAEDPISGVLKQTFDFADYHLHKQDVMFVITVNQNTFHLKASRLKGIDNTSEPVLSSRVRMQVTTSTGNPTGELTRTGDFTIDIADQIPTQTKETLNELGVVVTGDTWSEFELQGKALVEFKKLDDHTVFVGNQSKGFVTS